MTRTPPRPTAECAIGPAQGTYAAALPSHPDLAAGHALRPMARDATIHRAPPTSSVSHALRYLHKQDGTPLCPPPAHTCWGASGTPQELDYICCDPDESCFVHGNGDPGCRLRSAPIQAVASLPLPGGVRNLIGPLVRA